MKRKKKSTSYFLNDLVNTFTFNKFIQSLTTPFNKMKAFKDGYIDEDGNILDAKKITPYERMIIGIKKLLMQIPNPSTKAKLKNLTTTIQLFAESSGEIGADPEVVYNDIMSYLEEEMTSGGMAIGNNQIAGLGDDVAGLPISPKVQKKWTKSNKSLRKLRRLNVSDEAY